MAKARTSAQTKQSDGRYGLQVLDRVFDLLDQLAAEPATVAELSSRLDLHRSTVFRLLANLSARGYAVKNEGDGTYRLGMRFFYLGTRALRERIPVQQLRPFLETLAAATGHTTQLWMREATVVTCVDQVESPADLRVVGRVGRTFPIHAATVGRAILAHCSPSIVDRALSGRIEKLSARTETDPAKIRRELNHIRSQGYADAAGENPLIAEVIAAAVLDLDGSSDLGVAVLLPSHEQNQRAIGDQVRACADAMAQDLGTRSVAEQAD
jgi:DNA-binding IclR family transcriptional regulator